MRRERLSDRAVDLLAKNAEDFHDAQIRPQGLRVGERGNLTAGVKMLRETGDIRVGVRSGSGVELIIVFGGERVLDALVPVEIRDRLVGGEIGCAGDGGVFREIRRGVDAIVGPRDQILSIGKLVLKQRKCDRA